MVMETAAVPVLVSVVLVLACAKIPRLSEFGSVIAVSIAFFCGWASQDWTTLSPTRYLDWLPYTGIGLAVLAVPVYYGVPGKYAKGLLLSGCAIAAWLLVPDFPKLQPSRPMAILIVAAGSAVVVFVTGHAQTRLPSRILPATLMLTGIMAALVLAQSFGLKFAQIAGMLTASLAGPLVFPGKRPQVTAGPAAVFIPLLCSLMFMGYAASSSAVPVYSFALIPLAALPLLIVAVDEKPRSKQRIVAAIVGITVLLGVAVVPAVLAHPPWQEDY